jgi:acetyl esterase/lipase
MRSRLAVAACLFAFLSAAHAQPIPTEDLMKPAAFSRPALSASGRYVAVLTPVKNRLQLVVVDLETKKAERITDMDDFDVMSHTWVGDDRILFSLGRARSAIGPHPVEGGGLFTIRRDGTDSKQLHVSQQDMRGPFRELDLAGTIPGNDNEVIAAGNLREADSIDLYRLDLRTGDKTLLTENRPRLAVRYVLDRKQVPRVVTTWVEDTLQFVVHYRKDAKSPWTELTRYDTAKGPTFVPLAFEADDRTLQVAWNGGRDTMAIFRYDPEAKKLGEMVAGHPRYDMGADASGAGTGGLLRDPKTQEIVGYAVEADRPQVVWVDDQYERVQKTVDAALPQTLNTFTPSPDGKRYLVTTRSDRRLPRWYLLDLEKKKLEELFDASPWLKNAPLVEQRSFLYRTRDGLEIPGYYFLPKDRKAGEKLPTVVHIHGGPAARADTWGNGFGWREGQLLASRGYAVIVPNFRVTPGLGSRIYYGGFGTFGRQMLEDHEDAAKWAVAEGIADPGRICLSGASYGGYATLMSLARFPATFKCGVAGLIVSDLFLQLTSRQTDFSRSEAAVEHWRRMIGVKDLRDIPPELSPINNAAKIKAPVFIYAGEADRRTPIEQTRRMVSALGQAGNAPKGVVVKLGEGHGYIKTENSVELYDKIYEFLAEQIGSGRAR